MNITVRTALAGLLVATGAPAAGLRPGGGEAQLSAAGQDARATFAVGTATARRGQKAYGVLKVPAGSDAGYDIPVVVVHGARPGPVLAIVAGAHGTEYASIIAVETADRRPRRRPDRGHRHPGAAGQLPSFERSRADVNPVDGKNMNRFYPGRADGTQTERASYADHEAGRRAVRPPDRPPRRRPRREPAAVQLLDEDGQRGAGRVSREMVLAFGLDRIVVSTDRPKDPAASRYLENTATTRLKPSITAEAGHAAPSRPRTWTRSCAAR